ncbi:nuclear transcription factor Y subunit A-3 isoform X2 [Manihot esculenta]|uniref:Uncharacterized protein n=3 Tax=Manihot esculenta TaxID=3983 RepID=A0ACB7G7T6_MANES|nr:nuclear transcription factor Y subunit A-3 isoform X2 [Manihot esculenta]KAG8636082.1 hypothetical protein MANES_16G097900v8 [Manihot esculenta]KAG8636083.1 hypothetical protein MANES_16G097900v8 [Manihot esculenta]KAG8636091.1 hypothetical protein MANES_16G097900v8 [Manihot esculenta]
MAVRIQNLPKKNFGQANFSFSCPSWWTSNEQQQSLSKNISFKVESPTQLYHKANHLGLQLLDQESSSIRSIGQSHNEVGTGGEANSQDQCISSESGQDEGCGKGAEGRMKPVFLFSTPEIALDPSQTDNSHSMARAPFPHADNYVGGLFTPYGRQDILGSQMVGMTTTRVALPLDLADDGPIYVNAKQYHGILRRRQSRAKLEAQNKLVKSRKPYLHESRHLHALNRVRGSGGRFLSTKKLQQSDPTSSSNRHVILDTIQLHQNNETTEHGSFYSRTSQSGNSNTTSSGMTSVSNDESIFRQSDHRFASLAAHIGGSIQSSGGLMCSGT